MRPRSGLLLPLLVAACVTAPPALRGPEAVAPPPAPPAAPPAPTGAERCARGESDACVGEGDRLTHGPGTELPWEDVRAALSRGCELGSAEGCLRLGEMLETGIGADRDLPGARGHYRRACEGGVTKACDYEASLGRSEQVAASLAAKEAERKAPGKPKRASAPAKVTHVLGGISKEAAQNVIARTLPKVRTCFERVLQAKTDLGGRVQVRFTIAQEGEVGEAVLDEVSLPSARAVACILHTVREMRFPRAEAGGTTVVTFPWIFRNDATR